MRLLDPSDLDGSMGIWLNQMIREARGHGMEAAVSSAQYLRNYRLAETGSAAGPLIATLDADMRALRGVLEHVGPVHIKQRISEGVSMEVAFKEAIRESVAAGQKAILASGRGVVRESARANSRSIGWRRVSDGDPCAFCAMLVSRGPSYTEYAEALTAKGPSRGWVGKYGNPDPYHNHCGCTVEEIFTDWTPTEAEQRYVDAYYDAAKEADAVDEPRLASTVLWRMRTEGDFRDSPVRRAVLAE